MNAPRKEGRCHTAASKEGRKERKEGVLEEDSQSRRQARKEANVI
jgi:hypothetical protein